jgi:hypothetical protein
MFISKNKHQKLPLLIDYYSNTTNFSQGEAKLVEKILNEFNNDHFLEPKFLEIIKRKLQ